MTVPERLAALNALRDGPERQAAIIAAMEDSAIPVRDAAIRLAARYIEPHVLGTFVADDVNAVLRNAAIAASWSHRFWPSIPSRAGTAS